MILFGILLVLAVQNGAESRNSLTLAWDYLYFVQQWPTTFCLTTKCDHERAQPYWTIHGIWPQKFKAKAPENCNKSLPFDINQVKSLEEDLLKFWPGLVPGANYTLWAHEWDKHGTCYCKPPISCSEYDYFSTGLTFRKIYPVQKYLESFGIVPNDTRAYLVEDFLTPFQKQLSVNVTLACVWDKEIETLYMSSIRLCLDKNLSLFSCPSEELLSEEPCHPGKKIKYPEFKKKWNFNRANDLK